jgi:tetratricopeptide (TPR) repeat protein
VTPQTPVGTGGVRLLALAVLLMHSAGPAVAQDARTLADLGDRAQAEESYARAVELYKGALSANRSYLRPLVGLAESYFALEEYEEALRHAQEARSLARSDTAIMNLEARIRIGMGDLGEAARLFAEVVAREPNNLDARFGQAELDVAAGRTQQAATRYLQSLQTVPNNKRALVSLAYLYDDLGQPEVAARYVDLALRFHMDDAEVHLAAARQMAAETPARAVEHLELALAVKAGYREAALLLARLELNAANPDTVVARMTELLGRNRADTEAWYLLGVAQSAAGRVPEAINAYSSALRLEPDYEIARIALEHLALDRLPMGDSKRSELSDYHTARGDLLRQRHYLDKALVEYRRALILQPEAVQARLSYASVHRALGFPRKYLKELEVLDGLGKADANIQAEIEVRSRELDTGVARAWDVDQYGIERAKRGLLVVSPSPAPPAEVRLRSEVVQLVRYLRDMLLRNDTLLLAEPEDPLLSFDRAYRWAREHDLDYFLTVRFGQTERSFSLDATLHLGRTATALAPIRSYRTGNDRVRDAVMLTAEGVAGQLPLRGTLLGRVFSRGLIDLGQAQTIEPGLVLDIVKQGSARIEPPTGALGAPPLDRLGTFTVETTDENVAEGTIALTGFFDRINVGDAVILPPPPAVAAEPEPRPRGLLQRLFGIGGAP